MLHIINKSPLSTQALTSCLRIVQADDVILLIEDAVIAALNNTAFTTEITSTLETKKIYALKDDLIARGVLDKVISKIKIIDYAEFVDLTVQHYPIQSWT